MALTLKRLRFVEEYLLDLNETQAAIRAGFSARSAGKIGHELFVNAEVKAVIDAAIAARTQRTHVKQDAVIDRLDRLAMKAELAGDFAPAIRATELIGQHSGMFRKRVELTGRDGGPVPVAQTTLTPDEFRAIAQEVASKF